MSDRFTVRGETDLSLKNGIRVKKAIQFFRLWKFNYSQNLEHVFIQFWLKSDF